MKYKESKRQIHQTTWSSKMQLGYKLGTSFWNYTLYLHVNVIES